MISRRASARVANRRRCTSSRLSEEKNASATLLTPYRSRGRFSDDRDRLSGAVVGQHALVDLTREVALQAADDLSFGESLGGAAGDVVDGGLVEAHADDDAA